MFGKTKLHKKKYDKDHMTPIIKCSICTGEKVAGFKDKKSGKFTEVMLLRDDSDLRIFMETYDIETEPAKVY